MITGRPKAPLVLADEERLHLKAVANRARYPRLVMRARLILLAADAWQIRPLPTSWISASNQFPCAPTLLKQGFAGCTMNCGPDTGSVSDEKVPSWSVERLPPNRRMVPIGRCAPWPACPTLGADGARIWHAFGLQPQPATPFQTSPDPFFVEKVRDIVGLY